MSPQTRAKLRTKIRELISKELSGSRFGTSQLVDTILLKYPQLVEEAKDMLFREAISKWAGDALRSDAENLRSLQIELPGELKGVRLPAYINVPPRKPAKAVESDSEAPNVDKLITSEETTWVPTEQVSFDELERYVERRRRNIVSAEAGLGPIMRVYNLVRRFMEAEHRDEAIGPFLVTMAQAERESQTEVA